LIGINGIDGIVVIYSHRLFTVAKAYRTFLNRGELSWYDISPC